eukprot:SAG11_NODE_17486_length_517_cov_0.918660_1_plen_70_part_01
MQGLQEKAASGLLSAQEQERLDELQQNQAKRELTSLEEKAAAGQLTAEEQGRLQELQEFMEMQGLQEMAA